MREYDPYTDPVLAQIVASCNIDVPADRVEEEAYMMEMELKHVAQYSMMAGQTDMLTIQTEMEERMKEIPENAYRMVKTDIVLERLISKKQLEPNAEMMREEALRIGRERDISEDMLEKFFGSDYSLLKKDLQIRMAMELIHQSEKDG